VRPSLRFLALALVGWAGLRAATLGVLPGAHVFRVSRSEAKAPPIVPTQFPPIDPIEAAPEDVAAANFRQAAAPTVQYTAPQSVPRTPIGLVYYVPASNPTAPSLRPLAASLPTPRPQFYAPIPALGEWPLSGLASAAYQPLRSSVVTPAQSLPAAIKQRKMDRLQMTAWALLRAQENDLAGAHSLADNGSLGASQAGARLMYNFTPQIAATLRSSSDIGRRGGELAAGVRIQPARGIPIWFTAERRQRIGQYGDGRNAFALFAEGGVSDRPMPLHLLMDAYLQAGVVGFHSRDGFIDGALTLTRPAYKQFSAGFGLWGGAQPGLYRVDAGPRVTMRVRGNIRVHFDWRQRLAGNAAPGSGPAVTLAGDF
jgi:hypothetical protein